MHAATLGDTCPASAPAAPLAMPVTGDTAALPGCLCFRSCRNTCQLHLTTCSQDTHKQDPAKPPPGPLLQTSRQHHFQQRGTIRRQNCVQKARHDGTQGQGPSTQQQVQRSARSCLYYTVCSCLPSSLPGCQARSCCSQQPAAMGMESIVTKYKLPSAATPRGTMTQQGCMGHTVCYSQLALSYSHHT